MQLTPEQIEQLRKPFDEHGAFKGRTNEEVEKILNGAVNCYLTLVNINFRLKRTKETNGTQNYENNTN